jgi:prevent-host-death family protein
MTTKTASDARKKIRQVLDIAQHEPVAITRKGEIVAYFVSPEIMDQLTALRRERQGESK